MNTPRLSFREAVNRILSPSERKEMIYSYDLLGGMALIEIPLALGKKKAAIARTLLDTAPHIVNVYEKVGTHSGKYRVEKISWLAGKKDSVALYTEWGCRFRVDPGKVFFNARLGTERQRVAGMVKPNQKVAIFFSGVGPYPITIAKHTKAAKIFALEWNPAAKSFLEENVRLNKVESKVIPLWGDVGKIPVKEKVDHVVMPAPETALDYLPRALEWCKPKGIVHLYLFVDSTNTSAQLKSIIKDGIPSKYKWKQVFARRVSDFSPRKQQWCVGIQFLSKAKASIKKAKKKKNA